MANSFLQVVTPAEDLLLAPLAAIRAAAGLYTQFAAFDQVLSFGGAPDLEPERAREYDAGYEHVIGSWSRVSLTAYDRQIPNAIRRAGYETRLVSGRVVAGNITSAYENRVSSTSRGLELVFQRRVPRGVSGWLSYSYSRTRDADTRTGEQFWGDADQRNTLNAYALYRHSERTSFIVKLRVGSNFPVTGYYAEQDGSYIDYCDEGERVAVCALYKYSMLVL